MKPISGFFPVFYMGFSSILLQITSLRLLLSQFSGNELDIGITLSFWLLYNGMGSIAGKRMRFDGRYPFAVSFLIVGLIALPTVFGIKAIRGILSLIPGESVSLGMTIIATAATLLPLCFVNGMQFPLASSFIGGPNQAGKVYGLEAFGAFTGGILFTFFISTRLDASLLCLFIALSHIIAAALLTKKRLMLIACAVPLLLFISLHRTVNLLPWQGLNLSQTFESRYGEIAVIGMEEQSSVYSNGNLLFSYPNDPVDELHAHLPASLHKAPERILIIGGSPGIVKELLKYPVTRLDFIEIDPAIIEISLRLLKKPEDLAAVRDPRVRIVNIDGRKFIKGLTEHTYDLIALNVPNPTTASINRFYTSDFFKEARTSLTKGGVLALRMPVSSGYIGRRMQAAQGSVYNSLSSVFPFVALTSAGYGGMYASDNALVTEPGILRDRFVKREIETRFFHQYIFDDAFSPLSVGYVRERLADTDMMNTDLRPSAYMYNLMLWAEVQGSASADFLSFLFQTNRVQILIAAFVFLFCVVILSYRNKNRILYYSLFTSGFGGMTFMVAIVLTYQSMHGYVFEMIGLLTALFMLGVWAGTLITPAVSHHMKALLSFELAMSLLALASPLVFEAELPFYVLAFLSGILCGGLFNSACLAAEDPEGAGTFYGIDLTGSFLGTFISSVLIVPLFGVHSTLLAIVLLKIVSAGMILTLLFPRRLSSTPY
jgi:spermidine synthase